MLALLTHSLLLMTVFNIPEMTYTQKVTVNSSKVSVDASSPGWSITLTCNKWTVTTEGNIQVLVEFTPGNPMMLAQYNFKGRQNDKTGQPLNSVQITGAWPQNATGIQRGQNITASINPVTNVTTAITVDTASATLRAAPPPRRRVPIRRPGTKK